MSSLPRSTTASLTTRRSSRSRTSTPKSVYVGYGIELPEYKWDDYKGIDVRGKVRSAGQQAALRRCEFL